MSAVALVLDIRKFSKVKVHNHKICPIHNSLQTVLGSETAPLGLKKL